MSLVKVLLALIQAIPALKQLFELLIAEYNKRQLKEMQADNRDAIDEARTNKDQRPIERVMQSPQAGNPSGIPGTEIRDSLPNVPPSSQLPHH